MVLLLLLQAHIIPICRRFVNSPPGCAAKDLKQSLHPCASARDIQLAKGEAPPLDVSSPFPRRFHLYPGVSRPPPPDVLNKLVSKLAQVVSKLTQLVSKLRQFANQFTQVTAGRCSRHRGEEVKSPQESVQDMAETPPIDRITRGRPSMPRTPGPLAGDARPFPLISSSHEGRTFAANHRFRPSWA